MKKIAVVLSGCGFLDGAEITESTSTLIHLSQLGAKYQCFAPNKIFAATDHTNKEKTADRNALSEAARITRGNIKDITELKEVNFDAIVFPGGFGAALNLSDWGQKGAACKIDTHIEKIVKDFHSASKPIGAICIAPAIIAKILGDTGLTVTIGNDTETAQEITKTGAEHENCDVTDFITDRENKVITTPAYMYEAQPHEVFQGIGGMIKELVEMA